ncbi:MAG: alkaline phosphatase family protein [Ardenticatenia bacterium]|nr:alkaline phosphatase family protein [Ardenticatenia bacterium]
MPHSLYVFIDGLPYDVAQETDFLAPLCPYRYKVTPGFGYSVNIHAEMFCGRTPDEVGYLNEWAFDPENSPLRRLKLPRFVYNDMRRIRFPVVDRGLHVVLRNLSPVLAAQNVPFEYQHMFRRTQHSVYQDFPYTPFFEEIEEIHLALSETMPVEPGQRDVASFQQAMDALGTVPNMLVTFCDLDHFGHRYGVWTSEYIERVKDLQKWIARLAEGFLHRHKDGRFFVFSDHGMTNVHDGVQVPLESMLGDAGLGTYAYFLDSTILRLWILDGSLLDRAVVLLNSLDCGNIVSEQDRNDFGVTSGAFGDLIFVLHEGHVFAPSFLGNALPKAMHGYHPNRSGQQTIFLANHEPAIEVGRTLDYYEVFKVG